MIQQNEIEKKVCESEARPASRGWCDDEMETRAGGNWTRSNLQLFIGIAVHSEGDWWANQFRYPSLRSSSKTFYKLRFRSVLFAINGIESSRSGRLYALWLVALYASTETYLGYRCGQYDLLLDLGKQSPY